MFPGPLFSFDLIRLARRGLQPRLRVVLVGFLLVALASQYIRLFPAWMPYEDMLAAAPMLTRNEMSRFGEAFMIQYLWVQLIAVILFTPVYAAGGILEEKNRRTLEFLQASQLSRREIILGKFGARIAFVLTVVLSGVPVLMLTAFFGGIDPELLLFGFAIAIVEAIFLGSYATMQAVKFRTLGAVLFRSYILLVGFTLLGLTCVSGGDRTLSAFSGPTTLAIVVWPSGKAPDHYYAVALFIALHLLASMAFLESAVVRLRRLGGDPDIPAPTAPLTIDTEMARRAVSGEDILTTSGARVHPLTGPHGPVAESIPLRNPLAEIDLHAPPIGDNQNPIVWKDLHFTGKVVRKGTAVETLLMMGLVVAIYPILLYLFVAVVKDIHQDRWIGRTVNEVVLVFLEIVLLAAPLVAGVRTAAGIGTERQQDTLLGLLTLPWDRSEILKGKWWSAIHWLRGPLRIAAGVLIGGVLLLGVTPYAALCAAALIAGFTAFVATLGLALSVYCTNVMRATMCVFAVWLAVVFVPLFSSVDTAVLLSPPFALYDALEYGDELNVNASSRDRAPHWHTMLLGFGYAGVAWLLWRAAATRFEREGLS